jgi:hypothetical protein
MDIKKEYEKLNNPQEYANAQWYRNRGFDFERLINNLLKSEGLEPRTSYKVTGEQIDGSFVYGNRVYLLEAKWHKDEMPASKIYEFKGKVDGKLIGTVGIFISMSGFSPDAVDALLYGKAMNVLLFDKDDFDACIQEEDGFTNALRTKIRKAAEEGTAYYPIRKVLVNEEKNTKELEIGQFAFDLADNKLLTVSTDGSVYGELVIVCEGKIDQLILSLLTKLIMQNKGINKKVSVIAAMGKYTVAHVASSIKNSIGIGSKLLMVTDSDGDIYGTKEKFRKIVDYKEEELIVIDDKIEVWLENEDENLKKVFERLKFDEKREIISQRIMKLDMERLKANKDSFNQFYSLVSNL